MIRDVIFTDVIILEFNQSFVTGKKTDRAIFAEFPFTHSYATYMHKKLEGHMHSFLAYCLPGYKKNVKLQVKDSWKAKRNHQLFGTGVPEDPQQSKQVGTVIQGLDDVW